MEVTVKGITNSPTTQRCVEVSWNSKLVVASSSPTRYIVLVRLSDKQEWSIAVNSSAGSNSLLFDATEWQRVVAPTVTVMGHESPSDARRIKVDGNYVGMASLEQVLNGFQQGNGGQEGKANEARAATTVARGDGDGGTDSVTTSFTNLLLPASTEPPPVLGAAGVSSITTAIAGKPNWKPLAVSNTVCDDENPSLIRLEDRMCQKLVVICSLDESTSRLTSVASWTFPGLVTPDSWQVTVVNKTWSQGEGDNCVYHQWLFLVDKEEICIEQDTCRFKIPLWFRPGNRYEVTIRGLKRCGLPYYNGVVYSGSNEFRAGPVLLESEVWKLHKAALTHVGKNGDSAECRKFYRNKSQQYFDRIIHENNGRMTTRLKDASGDLRSPINGELSGLFFSANAQPNGDPISTSPFGDTRLFLEVREVLKVMTNVYFADFYCTKAGGPHYVILVLTRPGSEADEFCQKYLPQLSFDDRPQNPFLYRKEGRIHVDLSCMVEVFYTEDIDDINKHTTKDNIPRTNRGASKPGGIAKFRGCRVCDCFSKRHLDNKPSDIEEF